MAKPIPRHTVESVVRSFQALVPQYFDRVELYPHNYDWMLEIRKGGKKVLGVIPFDLKEDEVVGTTDAFIAAAIAELKVLIETEAYQVYGSY